MPNQPSLPTWIRLNKHPLGGVLFLPFWVYDVILPSKPWLLLGNGFFPFLLIVVEWLKSNHFTAKNFTIFGSPSNVKEEAVGFATRGPLTLFHGLCEFFGSERPSAGAGVRRTATRIQLPGPRVAEARRARDRGRNEELAVSRNSLHW